MNAVNMIAVNINALTMLNLMLITYSPAMKLSLKMHQPSHKSSAFYDRG